MKMRRGTAVALLFLLVLAMSSCAPRETVRTEEAAAQQTAPQPPVEDRSWSETAPTQAPPAIAPPPPPTQETRAEEQYVMLNFENADIETVVSTIGEMLKINYILTPGVTGKITIQSHNKIPLSELYSVFQTLLEFNGFTAVRDGSFYRIVPIDTAKQQPVPVESGKKPVASKDGGFVTQEIPLEYVKASDVANIVRNLMPRGTDLVVYEPSNMLIVTAPPSGILKLLKLLEAIDIPSTERDSIKTFVYYVENAEAKKLADILKNIYEKKRTDGTGAPVRTVSPQPTAPQPPAARPLPRPARTPVPPGATVVEEGFAGEIEGDVLIEAFEDINALIIKSTPKGYLTLLETVRSLDIQPKQVLIEVLIAEITLKDETKFGIEWLLKGGVHAEGKEADLIGGFTNKGVTFDSVAKQFVTTLPTGAFVNIFDPKKFAFLLTAAATNNDLNVLASPHILALDNKEAKIEIADEVPVATSISQPQTTIDNTISQVQFKSAGTILTVTPHINEKKQVTLKLTQEVSELGAKVPIGGQDFQGFTTRKATTSAIVQDGHTLIIGGIINERKSKGRSGIPYLSKIPILGYLFGTTSDLTERRELILMVTPHVVANLEEADLLTREYKNRVKDLKRKIEQREARYKQADTHLHNEEDNKDKEM